jgi:hypothetical protein
MEWVADFSGIRSKERQPLNKQRARDGARRLAAAVTLSNEVGILVPDIAHERTGIDAETILADWENPNDVRKLLERGIFNGILFGAVRFRHRDTRQSRDSSKSAGSSAR